MLSSKAIDEAAELGAELFAKLYNDNLASYKYGFRDGVRWAIGQMQSEALDKKINNKTQEL